MLQAYSCYLTSLAASFGQIASDHLEGLSPNAFIVSYPFISFIIATTTNFLSGLFFFAMNFAIPPLLKASNNWGAFIFFASWCFIAIIYTFLMIPETRSLSVEELDELFKGPWCNAHRVSSRKRKNLPILDSEHLEQSRLGTSQESLFRRS